MRIPQRHQKAFTLIELIVVIVILGILALIAIPTYNKVTTNTKLRSAETTLAAVSHEAQALAALNGRVVFGDQDITDATLDLASGTGVQAASSWTVALDDWEFSGSSRTLSADLVSANSQLSMALWVPGAGCAFSSAQVGGSVTTWSVADVTAYQCRATTATLGRGAALVRDATTLKASTSSDATGVTIGFTSGTVVDVYRDGVWVGSTSAGNLLDPKGTASSAYQVVPRLPGTITPQGTTPSTGPSIGSANSGAYTSPTGAVQLSWTSTGAANVYQYTSGSTTPTKIGSATTGTYLVTSASAGASYQVVPVLSDGSEGVPVPVTASAAQIPATPTGLTANVSGSTINASWAAVTSTQANPVTGYRLYRQDNGGSTWTNASKVYEGTALNKGLAVGSATTACFKVSAYGPTGESPLSSAYCVTPPTSYTGSSTGSATGTVQTYTAAASGRYQIQVWGADGGTVYYDNNATLPYYSGRPTFGGQGAYATGIYTLTAGSQLSLLTGAAGGDGDYAAPSSNNANLRSGGGGGSFVVRNGQPLVVAGGGGGAGFGNSGMPGNDNTSGTAYYVNDPLYAGGTGGGGGKSSPSGSEGGGGGGWSSVGQSTGYSAGGGAYPGNGGAAPTAWGPGPDNVYGGMGGWGGGGAGGAARGGGGGGYSGGGGGGGGGGSYTDPSGTSTLMIKGDMITGDNPSGAGRITITYLGS